METFVGPTQMSGSGYEVGPEKWEDECTVPVFATKRRCYPAKKNTFRALAALVIN